MHLDSAFEGFPVECDRAEPSVDTDLIADFLLPYFDNLPREELVAKVREIIALAQDTSAAEAARCGQATRRRRGI